jgi:hypothetical protein
LVVAERPQVGVLDRPETTNLPDCTVIQKDAVASIGKIPGEIKEVPLTKKITIGALFAVIGIKNLGSCEIQRNGQEASLDEFVELVRERFFYSLAGLLRIIDYQNLS